MPMVLFSSHSNSRMLIWKFLVIPAKSTESVAFTFSDFKDLPPYNCCAKPNTALVILFCGSLFLS